MASKKLKEPYCFTFISRSGAGKGTQCELLKNVLERHGGKDNVFYVYTGDHLRELVRHKEFLAARLLDEKILKAGEKAPDSLAIWASTKELIHGVTETNHLIIDGSPRTALEAQALDEIVDFLDRKNVFHIWLNVSYKCAYDRLLARGRSDDKPESIKRRLAYYEKYVAPAVEFYKKDKLHKFLEIDGEQSVELVNKDIIKAVGL